MQANVTVRTYSYTMAQFIVLLLIGRLRCECGQHGIRADTSTFQMMTNNKWFLQAYVTILSLSVVTDDASIWTLYDWLKVMRKIIRRVDILYFLHQVG